MCSYKQSSLNTCNDTEYEQDNVRFLHDDICKMYDIDGYFCNYNLNQCIRHVNILLDQLLHNGTYTIRLFFNYTQIHLYLPITPFCIVINVNNSI